MALVYLPRDTTDREMAEVCAILLGQVRVELAPDPAVETAQAGVRSRIVLLR